MAERAAVHWTTVKDAEIRYIVGLLRKRDLNGITDLGIDEVSEKKGHRYLTLVTDTAKRRVIWVVTRHRPYRSDHIRCHIDDRQR